MDREERIFILILSIIFLILSAVWLNLTYIQIACVYFGIPMAVIATVFWQDIIVWFIG